ncbi:hypothetical protein D3C71_1765090 [compost metagenome]
MPPFAAWMAPAVYMDPSAAAAIPPRASTTSPAPYVRAQTRSPAGVSFSTITSNWEKLLLGRSLELAA